LPKTFPAIKPSRVPPAVASIQVNFCKNPVCRNFGVPAKERPKGSTAGDGYHSVKGGSGVPVLSCRRCGEYPSVKSNLAISEELGRMLADLQPPSAASCPNTRCANHGVPVSAGKAHYQSFGQTPIGSKRYRCKACDRTFTVSAKSTARQRQAHKNRMIFSLLMNKSPFRRICEVADIHPETLYQRIDFFYRQCQSFSASRDKALLDGMRIPRLYIAVDRQEYVVNWSNQSDKRNVVLHAVGSADYETGYVFGMHLDFDPALDAPVIEHDAAARGDLAVSYPFRRYARLWLKADYTDLVRLSYKSRKGKKAAPTGGGVTAEVTTAYDDLKDRIDVEAPLTQDFDTKLPARGMQVHPEYTLYGHFFFLKRLFGGVEKVRFFLDQESGIRAACLAAFCEEAKARRMDAFYVRINKKLTVNERRQALADSRADFAKARKAHSGLNDSEVELLLIKQRIKSMASIGKWSDRWLLHPFPSMSEPEKAICYLTDYGDYKPDHLARLYAKASLHPIDRFFMQVRRRVSLLERPIATSSASYRTWYGYSPYNPEVVAKLLTIFRVFYNYVLKGEDKKTPAMRLGLAQAPIKIEDLLYFVPAKYSY
jgi:transposase-like protein